MTTNGNVIALIQALSENLHSSEINQLVADWMDAHDDELLAGKADKCILLNEVSFDQMSRFSDFGATSTVASNVFTFTAGDGFMKNGIKYTKVMNPKVGDKIYISAEMSKGSTGSGSLIIDYCDQELAQNSPEANQTYHLSDVVTLGSITDKNEILFGIYGSASGKAGAVVTVAKPVLINLTQVFGAGNEPTKATMDMLLALFGGWISETDLMNNVDLYQRVQALATAIAGKMDAPSVAGTLGQVLKSNGDGTASWDDEIDLTDITNAVTTWLAVNISDGAVVDASLSTTGAAADAKKVGDEFASQSDEIGELANALQDIAENGLYLSESSLPVSEFENGSWSTSGTHSAASYRVRTKQSYHLLKGQNISLSISSGYKAVVRAFSSEPDGTTSKTQVGTTDWQTTSTVTYTAGQECWAVVTIGNTADTSLSVQTAVDNVTVNVPEYAKIHSETRIDNVYEEISEINLGIENIEIDLTKKAELDITFQNMFDASTMLVGNGKAYDKTGTIEGESVKLIDLPNYSAIKIPLHGETSVSVKQNGSNAMQLWGWYAVDENMVITSAYGSRISQYIQSGFTMGNIPATAKYLCLSIAYYEAATAAEEYLMVVQGSTPKDYAPYVSPWYQIAGLKSDIIPEKQEEIDANTSHRQWIGKGWAQYGDSISTYADNPWTSDGGWAIVANKYQQFGNTYMRGIGGQSFAYGAHGGSVSFINADGSLDSVDQSSNYDDYSGTVPSGTTKSRGAFCSWLRITSMFPESMKDNVDLVVVMGGTNDTANSTAPTWIADSTTDTEWAESDYYSDYGGDYNIDTLQGGVASTIMKMHAWMPNALIVIATPLNGRTGITGGKNPGTIPTEYIKSNQIIEAARMFGANVIDVFGGCGINIVNSDEYISDGVHPKSKGRILLGNFIAGELNRILPNGMGQ